MTQEAYPAQIVSRIDEAIALGKRLLSVSVRLHRTCDAANSGENRTDPQRAYFQDTMMYYDFNDATTEISGMPELLQKFKNCLIDIKLENDRLLLKGGFRADVDKSIAEVFLTHALIGVTVIDEKVLAAVKDAVTRLEGIKAEL